MKDFVNRSLAWTPYQITRRRGLNRFQYVEQALVDLRTAGFAPKRIIDGGAHLGDFSEMSAKLFPEAIIHLIEPQPACAHSLERLASRRQFHFHPVALGAPDEVGPVGMAASDRPSTGAYVRPCKGDGAVEVSLTTLDLLFPELAANDRTLLKLDLQGHELKALKGASKALDAVEVILTEVSFFGVGAAPTIPDLSAFLQEKGFCLYDIAALSPRFRDNRLRQGDFIFVRRDSPLVAEASWD